MGKARGGLQPCWRANVVSRAKETVYSTQAWERVAGVTGQVLLGRRDELADAEVAVLRPGQVQEVGLELGEDHRTLGIVAVLRTHEVVTSCDMTAA